MGEAKRRGNKEQRISQAQAREGEKKKTVLEEVLDDYANAKKSVFGSALVEPSMRDILAAMDAKRLKDLPESRRRTAEDLITYFEDEPQAEAIFLHFEYGDGFHCWLSEVMIESQWEHPYTRLYSEGRPHDPTRKSKYKSLYCVDHLEHFSMNPDGSQAPEPDACIALNPTQDEFGSAVIYKSDVEQFARSGREDGDVDLLFRQIKERTDIYDGISTPRCEEGISMR